MVDWSYYDRFDEIEAEYLPEIGEGETMATQAVTAICKLVYKWYNDGDVFDNVHTSLGGWGNDLSSYANWLAEYVDGTNRILCGITGCRNDEDYEDLLKDLTDKVFDEELLKALNALPKRGSIYKCDGYFEFDEHIDDDEDEWDDEWYDDEEDEDY